MIEIAAHSLAVFHVAEQCYLASTYLPSPVNTYLTQVFTGDDSSEIYWASTETPKRKNYIKQCMEAAGSSIDTSKSQLQDTLSGP